MAADSVIDLVSSDDENFGDSEVDGCDRETNTNKNNTYPTGHPSDILQCQDQTQRDTSISDALGDVHRLEFLRNHCWVCHLWVHHPRFVSNDNEDEICCNALHLHPVLNVPVCVVCAETVEAVERKQRLDKKSSVGEMCPQNGSPRNTLSEDDGRDDDVNACSACGKVHGEEEYVRCDACPRVICTGCYEQALGPTASRKEIAKLPRWQSESTCFCCSCLDESINGNNRVGDTQDTQRDDFIQKLQSLTMNLFSSATESTNGNRKQSIEDALDELYCLETEKKKCESQLDDPKELLQDIREELWVELGGNLDEEDEIREILVQERYQERYQEWIHHQTRLLDRISILGDRLKSEYGIEIAAAMRYIEADNAEESEHECKKIKSEEAEPTWKIAADNELRHREKEERSRRRKEEKNLARKRSDDPKYLLEITEDVEDLGSSDETDPADNKNYDEDDDDSEVDAYDNGWRNAPFKAQIQEIEMAREAEDRRRIEVGKSKFVVRNKRDDVEEINEWDAGMKSSATLVKKKNRKRKRHSTRTISLPNGRDESREGIASQLSNHRKRKRDRNFSKSRDDLTKGAFGPGELPEGTTINIMVPKTKYLQPSSFVLSENPFICVAREFDRHLKEHQKEGIKFMYSNTFADLGGDTGAQIGGCILAHSMGLGKSLCCVSLLHAVMEQPSLVDAETGLAKIHTGLLVVPVNTIANWENEFEKWTKGTKTKLTIFNVSSADKYSRRNMVIQWSRLGGILLTSINLFRSMADRDDVEQLLSATDVVVVDESHTMLKNKESKAYKALKKIKTRRKVCLTGTPFQNNLLEYYRMISYVRPSVLGCSEKKFQREYMDPIQASMGSDAAEDVKIHADNRLTKFVEKLEPFIHRRDASLLLNDLPSLQQVCLHFPPTKMQRALYGAFREHQEVTSEKNFLKQYSSLRTVHNHPGTLLFRNEKPEAESRKHSILESKEQHPMKKSCEYLKFFSSENADVSNETDTSTREEFEEMFSEQHPLKLSMVKKEALESHVIKEESIESPVIKAESIQYKLPEKSSPTSREPQDPDAIIEILSSDEEDDDDENDETNNSWWAKVAKKFGTDNMKSIESGNKCIFLLHMLSHATTLGEKTVVFSQSLKTLDFLSDVIATKDWRNVCPSLKNSFPNHSIGGWEQGKDFLRIDGGTSSIERGELLKDFYDDKNLKLFLISSIAGGIGINLVSASRVVLFDSHFNPSIDLQAIFRCYRYGQTRNVFAYRLLTQGSMEEKVFSRAVNKTSLGNRVIDGKKLHRCFEKDEINNLSKVDDWVECVKCHSWRMFPPDHTEDIANIPDDWNCKLMNKHDARMKWSCSFEEKDTEWYHRHFKKPNRWTSTDDSPGSIDNEFVNNLSPAEREKLVKRDEILKKILHIKSSLDSSNSIISKFYFDTLLMDTQARNTLVNGKK